MPSINPIDNNNFGIFGLNDTRTSIITTTPTAIGIQTGTDIASIVDIGNWSQESTHGWFGGGLVPGAGAQRSTIDRIDFSNDSLTASVRSPFTVGTYSASGVSNFNYGWFGGGYTATPLAISSKVERLDFSNDSTTPVVRGTLNTATVYSAAVGNNYYGWFGGGYNTVGTRLTSIQRIDFSNDFTTASVRGPLTLGRIGIVATGNSNFGWFGGGASAPASILSTVNRVDFANDFVTTSIRGPLSSGRYFVACSSNSNYGWFFGGDNVPAPGTIQSIVNRIDFSNDSLTASVRGSLAAIKTRGGATGNSNYGWFGGGTSPITPIALFSSVERIDFSNDSATASVRGPLTLARQFVRATSGQAKSSSIRPLRGGNFGWFGGGNAGSPSSTIDRIDFSNDSVAASSRSLLSAARYEHGATGNSNYGWFATGRTSSPIATASSIVDRVDFSNDSALSSVRGPLNSVRFYKLAATSNSNYGWFAGGNDPAPGVGTLTTVERIDFSNDLSAAKIRGSLSTPAGKAFYDATGNSNYGWFGGAAPGAVLTRVDRLDYANDLSNTTVRGPMSATRYKSAATGNSNYGWWGGGSSQPPLVANSIVDRIDFSNDSTIALVRGPLSEVRDSLAATGNSNYGWWGGGSPSASPLTSNVERIDFSNDSSSTSARGPLSQSRRSLAATSNTPVG